MSTYFKQPGVCVETAGVENAVLPLMKLCQLLLQVFVQILRYKNKKMLCKYNLFLPKQPPNSKASYKYFS